MCADTAPFEHEGLRVLDGTRVFLERVCLASEVSPAVGDRSYLHAGPPLPTSELIPPMYGAVVAALMFEGEAADAEQAEAIIRGGGVSLRSCHEVGAVGAATGLVSPHTPVVVVRTESGRSVFSPLHEGAGPSMRYGAFGPETLDRLRWLAEVMTPALDEAISASGPIEITALQAEGLRRGDECHNRNVASSASLAILLAPGLASCRGSDAAPLLQDLGENGQFFLAFSMAAAKAVGDEAHQVADPGMVTAIAANGRHVGIRVSGCGDRWFLTPSPYGKPQLFEGYTPEDASALMGDSFATEVIGLGAMAASAAPALASFLGTDPMEAEAAVAEMRQISQGTSTRFLVPAERYEGTPIGIDVAKVCRTRIAPLVNGGFAHRKAGVGMVGAGVVRLPIEPFDEAMGTLTANASLASGAVDD